MASPAASARVVAGDSPWRSSLLLVAGLAGASGVMLSAIAAHLRQSAMLETSAYFLMSHAIAVIAIAALAGQTSRVKAWLAIATAMLTGAVLFSADLAVFAVRRVHIFPMAAPLGGLTLILSWFAISVMAAVELASPRRVPDLRVE